MMDPELAIAVSVRSWPDEIRRFLADHGGARVRLTAMSPADLGRERFDVLLIDDVCSYLTTTLVSSVKSRGSGVLGVFDPVEYPDGKDRLLDCGVTDVIDANAEPDEFLERIARVKSVSPQSEPPEEPVHDSAARGALIVVFGAAGGVGATEVASVISRLVAKRNGRCGLIDLDFEAASVAQRFDLEPHPNLLTAIDAAETDSTETALQAMGPVAVLAGVPAGAHLGSLRAHQVSSVVDTRRSAGLPLVLDVGTGLAAPPGLLDGLVAAATRVVAVGGATPVGVARIIRLTDRVGRVADLIVNRAPRGSFRRGEITAELARSCQARSLAFVPEDSAVADAAWDGRVVKHGRFVRALTRWYSLFGVGETR